MNKLQGLLQEYTKKQPADFRVGDIIRVEFKIREGELERTSSFEGVVISKRGEGLNSTFTVRKKSFGVGVERIFPLCSRAIIEIRVIKQGKFRRAKLYYLRRTSGTL